MLPSNSSRKGSIVLQGGCNEDISWMQGVSPVLALMLPCSYRVDNERITSG